MRNSLLVCCPLFMACVLLFGCSTDTSSVAEPDDHGVDNHGVDVSSSVGGGPAAPGMDRSGAPAEAAGPDVELEKIKLAAPAAWKRQQLSSQFVDAEFAIPRAEGDDQDGRLTVSRAGGSMNDNIERWRGQFGGKPEKESKKEIEAAGFKITVVDYSGEFNDQRGPFAPATKRAGYRMLAAIIPVGDELHFVKCTGPEKTVAAHAEEFEAFLKSLQKK